MDITALVAKPIAKNATCSTTTGAAAQTQAGAHEDFCLALGMNGYGGNLGLGDDVKDLKIALPSGQVGNANATPRCDAAQFQRQGGCPSSTRVGEVSADIEAAIPLNASIINGPVHNLTPRGTEAARLGLVLEFAGLFPAQKIEVEIRLRIDDGGLDSLSFDQPRDFVGIPIELRKLNLRLWGSKTGRSMEKSFMANPTDCTRPATTRVDILAYSGGTDSETASYTPTGCDQVPFEPAMILEGDRASDAPGMISTGVAMPANDEPLVQRHIQRSVNVLPEGVELSPTSGSVPGFVGCTAAEFGYRQSAPSTCPAGAKIGTVRFRSPLIAQPVEGDIFLAQPTPTSPKIRLFVVGELGPQIDATRVKFVGVVRPDPATGQLVTTFDDLPATPFTEFRLTFRGGPTAIMSLPRSCGTFTGQAINVPWGGTAQDTRTATLPVDQNCADPDPFGPALGLATSTTQAASGTALVTTLARPDGHARLTGAKISLPAGLQGNLTLVPPCSLAEGRAGVCGAASRVGSVVAIAGPGSSPTTLNGDVYFTAPPTPGALAGLSIVVPAAFGPLDLGKIVVAAEVSTRADTGLDITVSDIPQRAEGISTQVRSMQLVLDKPGFFVTPSACDPKTATGTLFSDLGQAAAVSAGFQATGCENLPFAPKLATTIDGGATGSETALNGHPGLNVSVTQAPGEANNASVDVTLPSGMAPDSDRLGRTCALAQYEVGNCPDSARVGRVVAYTPLLPEPIQGAVTFVTVPGSPLPELRADLRGQINLTLNGKIKFGPDGRMVNSFVGIPDVPLSRFDFTLEGGARGLVIATKDLCATSSLPFDGAFTAHSGADAKTKVQPRLDGCAPRGTLRVGSLRTGSPTLDLRVVGGRTRVRTAQLVVPRGMEFQRAAIVRKRLKVSATGLKKGSRARVTVTGQSIRVTVPSGQSAKVLRVRLSRGALRASTRLRKQGRPQLTFRLNTTTTDDRRTRRQSLRVRPAAR